MQWIAPAEKDVATDTLEKRPWAAADQFRANSGLRAAQYSQPILGLIFLRFAEGCGESYTPSSIVRLLTEVIEPDLGLILDGACGSGGMFVSSARFVRAILKKSQYTPN
jgi:type I restriction-modification system DNA methylase subunit